MGESTILVVDDEPEIRELLGIILSGAGYSVEGAQDGMEASKMMLTKPFDVVVTDMLMPEKDGLEFIAELRKKHPAVRIVAMTGGGHIGRDSYLRIARGFGAHVLMEKPFLQAEVLA